ncbi:MAG: type II toxin-antitoxin system Phd/YefM family antitoxin [Candidatus Binatia bacterium]
MISALEMRKKFGSVLELVTKQGIPVTICRAGKPLAVLVPIEDYQSKNFGREHRLRLAKRINEWKKRHTKKLKGLDVTRMLRASRAER